jgi:hypothetical protein
MGNAARSCAARGLVAKSRVLAGAVTTVVVFSLVSAVPASAASTAWAVVASPSPGPDNSLNAVSCATSRWCVSVGGYADAVTGLGRTLVETWDGTSWRIVPSPNVGAGNNGLFGVSCATPRSCVAVGVYDNLGPGRTLVETWDGKTWTVTPSPTPGLSGYLSAVSCATATSCVAVGFYTEDWNSPFRTLVETWDGAAWTIVPSPSPGTTFNFLNGVSCPIPTACVAVGNVTSAPGTTQQTLVLSNMATPQV